MCLLLLTGHRDWEGGRHREGAGGVNDPGRRVETVALSANLYHVVESVVQSCLLDSDLVGEVSIGLFNNSSRGNSHTHNRVVPPQRFLAVEPVVGQREANRSINAVATIIANLVSPVGYRSFAYTVRRR